MNSASCSISDGSAHFPSVANGSERFRTLFLSLSQMQFHLATYSLFPESLRSATGYKKSHG